MCVVCVYMGGAPTSGGGSVYLRLLRVDNLFIYFDVGYACEGSKSLPQL